MTTFGDLLKQVKTKIKELQPAEVAALKKKNPQLVLIDVREAEEWQSGVVPGAITIPRGLLELSVEDDVPDRNAEIVCYCAGGVRSALATQSLQQMGYQKVSSMSGGFNGWKNAGLPIETKQGLSQGQMSRYARHLTLPEVGEEGQLKLIASKILLIGAGGLGCPAAIYLAAAGVGTIGIVDFDQVDLTNLQRQILHTEADVGRPKTDSARRARVS